MYDFMIATFVIAATIAICVNAGYVSYNYYMAWVNDKPFETDRAIDWPLNEYTGGEDFVMFFVVRLLAWLVCLLVSFVWPVAIIFGGGVALAHYHRAQLRGEK